MSSGHDNVLPKGYMGKILRVDLSKRSWQSEPTDGRLARLFFGGRGLGVALLCRHFLALQGTGRYGNVYADLDALSEDNIIIISTSPTTGSKMPTSGRMHMNFKSPLTGAYGSSNAGGRWGVDFKRNGFDALLITGRAERPVFLVIEGGVVSIEDATAITSLDAVEARSVLRERYSKNAQILSIGAGGRNLVRFATVMSDTGKAFGRGGGGAVWGSKNLQAIVVLPQSSVKIEVAHPEQFEAKNEGGAMYHAKLKLDLGKFTKREDMFGILSSMGSLGILGMVNNYSQLLHNNMRDTDHAGADIGKINGEALRYHSRNAAPGARRIEVKKSACFNCPIVCKRETTLLDADGTVIDKGEGPEFETTALLGANLSIYDLTVISQASYLANRYGLDTISLGSTIAAFFELYAVVRDKKKVSPGERQLREDVKEFVEEYGEPAFGRPELLLPVIHLIGRGEGVGRYLGQGSQRFCSRYGHAELSMSIKGLELPAYDPRTSYSQALCYEMNNRGGGHLQGGYTAPHAYCAGYAEWPAHRLEGTPLISKNATLKNTALDIIGACAYGSFSLGLDEYAALVNGVTGGQHTSGTLKKLALRTITLEREFNRVCGLSEGDDWLPDRFYSEKVATAHGRVLCDREAFARMHREYYRSVGWDDHGRPTKDTLRDLELLDFIP